MVSGCHSAGPVLGLKCSFFEEVSMETELLKQKNAPNFISKMQATEWQDSVVFLPHSIINFKGNCLFHGKGLLTNAVIAAIDVLTVAHVYKWTQIRCWVLFWTRIRWSWFLSWVTLMILSNCFDTLSRQKKAAEVRHHLCNENAQMFLKALYALCSKSATITI